MRGQDWQDILTLLSMMILADEKIYQEEVEVFKKAAVALKDEICPEVMVTEKMAFDWFLLNRDNINRKMSSIYYAHALSEILAKLKPFPDKQALLRALEKIAVADGFQHGSESKLLKTAADAWGVDLKFPLRDQA